MRTSPLAMVLLLLLAGCGQPAEPGQEFSVRVAYDERGTYYVGDPVVFQAQASVGSVQWNWSLGDGTSASGATVSHAFARAGTYTVHVAGMIPGGATSTASASIEILDLFGAAPVTTVPTSPPSTPVPAGDSSGVVRLNLSGGEPTTGQPFALELTGPTFLGSGTLSLWLDGQLQAHTFAALPARIDLDGLVAGRHGVAWMADIDGQAFSGAIDFDVWGEPIVFGPPSAQQWLRPGVHSEVCTVNFLFHYKWYRFFIGSAAHCVDDLDITQVCQQKPTGKIGNKETLHAHDSSRSTSDAWVAYESWLTMERVGDKNDNRCRGNDFALIELGPDAQEVMHPAGLFFGGPTSLADSAYGAGTTLYAYGASNLHGNVGVGYPGQETVNRKQGVSLGGENGGFSQHVAYALPGVPGDSGGPAFGPGGQALGVASTITLAPTPGTNRYTVVAEALEYMRQHEGWAPELVIYDDWSATG